ncbi:MAG: ECF transporter S component [Clostridiaceae bacterium]|nr:ECF transporter S component [Clostridiaceae bacterium]
MNTTKTKKKQILGVRQLTLVGMLSGICIFLGLTRLGFIPLPFMNATIMQIPVIIGAIVEGPIVGAIVGLVFGLFSMYQSFTAPTSVLSIAFMNPIVAIIPRVLIGIVSYYVYKFIKAKFNKIKLSYGLASIAGTLTNTIGVLGLVYVFYIEQYAEANKITTDAVAGMIGSIILTNGIPEAVISAIIVVPVVTGLMKFYKRKN